MVLSKGIHVWRVVTPIWHDLGNGGAVFRCDLRPHREYWGNEVQDYKLGTPVLYLYRHWLELAVKSIIGPIHGHDLAKLSGRLTSVLLQRGIEVPKWVTARLMEMGEIDRSSPAFRYAEGSIPGETYVSVPHLRDPMTVLHAALSLVSAKGVFPPESLLAKLTDEDDSRWAMLQLQEWIS